MPTSNQQSSSTDLQSTPSLPLTLPSELWITVLGFLRRPIPQALSCAPRSDLSQSDLCTASRVSKHICQSILFRHIATDRLDLIFPSTAAEIPSKRRLLAHTVSLSLEYRSKQEQPSYEYLLEEKGAWEMIAPNQGMMDSVAMQSCKEEVEDIRRAFTMAEGAGLSGTIFPNLRRIAIGSIYGHIDETWMRYVQYIHEARGAQIRPYPLPPHPEEATRLFQKFCLTTTTLDDLCTRGQYGPLGLPGFSFSPGDSPGDTAAKPSKFRYITHLNSETRFVPACINTQMVYFSDLPSSTPYDEVIRILTGSFDYTAGRRKEAFFKGAPGDEVEVMIFASVSYDEPFPPNMVEFFANLDGYSIPPQLIPMLNTKEKRRSLNLGDLLSGKFSEDSGLNFNITWLPSADGPPCSSCCSFSPP